MTDMKRTVKYLMAAVCAAMLAAPAIQAQTLSGSYFLDGSYKRYQMNPALTPERGFFSFPALGNISVDALSSVGIENFIFNSTTDPSSLTTFMSPEIDATEFLDALPSSADIRLSAGIDLISFGFPSENGFNIVNIGLRNRENTGLPKDLFAFMKAGLEAGTYDITDINVSSSTYAEIAYAHSHRIGDKLTIGASLKVLLGLAYADLTIDEIHASLDEQRWAMYTKGAMTMGIAGAKYKTNADGTIDFDNMDLAFGGIGGYGFGVDLGAQYDFADIVPGLKASASLTDLGMIWWNNALNAGNDGTNEAVFSGFDTDGEDADASVDQLTDEFKKMVNLYDDGSKTVSSVLGATLRIGASYQLPWVNWLTVGELLTSRMGKMHYFESRTSVNMAPAPWFDASLNVAATSYGGSLGAVINFHPKKFNFFIGTDGIACTMNKQNIPVSDFRASVVLGISFCGKDK